MTKFKIKINTLQAQKFLTPSVTIRGDWKLPWEFTSVCVCVSVFVFYLHDRGGTSRQAGIERVEECLDRV